MNFLTQDVLEVAQKLMRELDCARSLSIDILMRYNEWDQIFAMKADPHHYSDAKSFLSANLATCFFKKLDVPMGRQDEIEAATLEKWWSAERSCFRTNQRLNELLDFGTLSGIPAPERIIEFLDDARKWFAWIVGDGLPPCEGRFGPGATVSDSYGRTTVLHKMSSLPTFTPSAFGYLVPWSGTKWASACAARWDVPETARGNVYFTAPKTALVRRPCAKEASINGFYQLGTGDYLRRRIKLRGIDLRTAKELHMFIAQVSSLTEEHATIDLTSASDTNALALVRALASPRWFNHLTDLRSPFTRVNGKWVRLEKFSSMGNGFTFELETAVFMAICLAVDPTLTPGHDLHVLGDDIIVPKGIANDVIWALKFCGFETNKDKTYVSGSFRESCGGDYYLGVPVRGFYLEKVPNEPQHFIAIANGIRRVCEDANRVVPGIVRYRSAWFKCLDNIPVAIRKLRGPEQLGDIVIHDDESRWQIRWRSSGIRWIGVYRPTRPQGTKFGRFDAHIQFAGALYGVGLTGQVPTDRLRVGCLQAAGRVWPEGYDGREVIGRDPVMSYKVGWVPFS